MNSDSIDDDHIQKNEDDNDMVRPDDIQFEEEDQTHVEPASNSDTDDLESEGAFTAAEEILRPSGD
jgi:hypothetical protein